MGRRGCSRSGDRPQRCRSPPRGGHVRVDVVRYAVLLVAQACPRCVRTMLRVTTPCARGGRPSDESAATPRRVRVVARSLWRSSGRVVASGGGRVPARCDAHRQATRGDTRIARLPGSSHSGMIDVTPICSGRSRFSVAGATRHRHARSTSRPSLRRGSRPGVVADPRDRRAPSPMRRAAAVCGPPPQMGMREVGAARAGASARSAPRRERDGVGVGVHALSGPPC